MIRDDDRGRACDVALGRALDEAAARLSGGSKPLKELREEELRQALRTSLQDRLPVPLTAADPRSIKLSRFQGVGPFDLSVLDEMERPIALAELKWSTSLPRDKIYEAAWDAIKLALAINEHSPDRAWLITGAPATAWSRSEAADLFAEGLVDVAELWRRPLDLKGPNGGRTVGEDCELGGRGNMFEQAPARLRVTRLASARLAGSEEEWFLQAVRVVGEGPMVPFASPPRFPATITQSWLDHHVHSMDEQTYDALLERLRVKRWTEAEISERVQPLRGTGQT